VLLSIAALESLPRGFLIDSTAMDHSAESKSLKDKVRDWLLEDDYTLEERTAKGASWLFDARAFDGRGVAVSQRAGKPDEVYIKLTVVFGEDVQAGLAGMSAGDRDSFYGEVQFYLLSQHVEFAPQGTTIWSGIIISERIFEDALTKDRLMRMIDSVRRGAAGVGWLLRDALPDLVPKSTKTAH
jgi:hypothetical protein